jgi:hypothetical protein
MVVIYDSKELKSYHLGIAQATDYVFDSQHRKYYSPPHSVQAHIASNQRVPGGGSFPVVKCQGREASHLHLVPRIIMVEVILQSPRTSSWHGA